MRKSWRYVSIVLLSAAALGGGLAGDRLLAVTDSTRDNLRLLTELIETAKSSYGRDVTYRDLVFSGIHGMLRRLDPHSNFLSPQAHSQMRERQQASFYGLGILVGLRNGRLTVITPIDRVVVQVCRHAPPGMGLPDYCGKAVEYRLPPTPWV